jgi:hypothetical protein
VPNTGSSNASVVNRDSPWIFLQYRDGHLHRSLTMNLETYLDTYREVIDDHIRGAVDIVNYEIDDQERMMWVMNDESLYNHAIAHCGLEEVLGVTDEIDS